MRCLLDANTLIFLDVARDRLSAKAKGEVLNPANELFLSVASIWEMQIKIARGKLSLSRPLPVRQRRNPSQPGATPQDMNKKTPRAEGPIHARGTHHEGTGFQPSGRDWCEPGALPQAGMFAGLWPSRGTVGTHFEGMSIITSDGEFAPYGVPVIW